MTNQSYLRARDFMLNQARPIERERYLVRFEGHSPEQAMIVLAAYRNPDGGFGKALEPDYRAKGSSVLATCMALGCLEELGVSGKHPLVEGAIQFLLSAFDRKAMRWLVVPGDGETEPHAPWWNWTSLEETFVGFRINPMAEAMANLSRYGQDEGRKLSRSLYPVLRQRMEAADYLNPSEVECLLALLRSPMDDPGMRFFLDTCLRQHLPSAVEKDPAKWGSYCLKPLWAVPDPASPGAAELGDDLRMALDAEVHAQNQDGSWEPFWHWDGAFPDHWPVARHEWRGWLTLRNLKALAAFDRLPKRPHPSFTLKEMTCFGDSKTF